MPPRRPNRSRSRHRRPAPRAGRCRACTECRATAVRPAARADRRLRRRCRRGTRTPCVRTRRSRAAARPRGRAARPSPSPCRRRPPCAGRNADGRPATAHPSQPPAAPSAHRQGPVRATPRGRAARCAATPSPRRNGRGSGRSSRAAPAAGCGWIGRRDRGRTADPTRSLGPRADNRVRGRRRTSRSSTRAASSPRGRPRTSRPCR